MPRDVALEAYRMAEQTEVKHNARLNKLERDVQANAAQLIKIMNEQARLIKDLNDLKRVLELGLGGNSHS